MESDGNKPNQFQPGNNAAAGHGAPVGNTNGVRHGRRSKERVTVGNLPKGCRWINTLLGSVRREL